MLNLRIGFLLGLRHIQRANPWANVLIVTIVLFTFLNLVAMSGILSGIVEGALREVRDVAVGDVVIKPLQNETSIEETERILRELSAYNEVRSFSQRYEGFAVIEANYKTRRDSSAERDIIAVNIQGIDPVRENQTMNLGSLITEGEALAENDHGYLLIGKYYIDRYAMTYGDIFDSLSNVYPGDSVRVTANGHTEEFIVKGIIDSKIDSTSLNVFMPEKDFRRFFNKADFKASSIVVRLNEGHTDTEVKDKFLNAGMGEVSQIFAFEESIPKSVRDTAKTFDLLGVIIGSIGVVVASITVFIIIFINILSKKRQIGILRAIGIRRHAIQYAYAFQAGFYAIIGSLIGVIITVYILVPYFEKNPIDFPYADVVLSTSPEGIASRCVALLITMVLAGMLPAWLITKQNTLDTILGRK